MKYRSTLPIKGNLSVKNLPGIYYRRFAIMKNPYSQEYSSPLFKINVC